MFSTDSGISTLVSRGGRLRHEGSLDDSGVWRPVDGPIAALPRPQGKRWRWQCGL